MPTNTESATAARDSAYLIKICDGLYQDPYYIREEAVAARYRDHSSADGSAFGSSSEIAFIPWGIRERICEAFGFDRVVLLPPYIGTGCFYHTFAQGSRQESFRVHRDGDYDPAHPEFAFLIYLSPHAPAEAGTGIYRHRETQIWKQPTEVDAQRLGRTTGELEAVLNESGPIKSHWELIGFANNVFNRGIIYPSHWFHCGTKYFGSGMEDARLYHMFFIRGWPDIFRGIEDDTDVQFASGNGRIFPPR